MSWCLALQTSLMNVVAVRRAAAEEHGATFVEYALMVSFIAMAIFMAVVFLGRRTAAVFNTTANTLPA